MRLLPLLLPIILCIAVSGFSQPGFIHIDSIHLRGNKKTRSDLILRELPFKQGDTLALEVLEEKLAKGEQWLMNTGLFNKAKIFFHQWEGVGNAVELMIEVVEAWYFYPIPLFELADRNFNVWWVDQNRSLDRINYGIDFLYRNATGRNDRLNMVVKQGYSQMLVFQYNRPYINAKKDLGVHLHTTYSRNREINYATISNRQAFLRLEDDFALTRFFSQVALTYRPGLAQYYRAALSFHRNEVSPEIQEQVGVDFFLNGNPIQRFFSLSLSYVYDDRDARPYPQAGSYFGAEIRKEGLGIFPDRNALTLWTEYQRFFSLAQTPLNLALSGRSKLSLVRQQQPYNDYRAVGFQRNTLRGYEYYVVEGLDMLLIKSSLRLKIWEDEINFGKLSPFEAFRRVPFKIFLAANSDWGYVNDPWNPFGNSFSNRWLWGKGLGLETVVIFNFVIRMEASMNHLSEIGFFLHLNMNI